MKKIQFNKWLLIPSLLVIIAALYYGDYEKNNKVSSYEKMVLDKKSVASFDSTVNTIFDHYYQNSGNEVLYSDVDHSVSTPFKKCIVDSTINVRTLIISGVPCIVFSKNGLKRYCLIHKDYIDFLFPQGEKIDEIIFYRSGTVKSFYQDGFIRKNAKQDWDSIHSLVMALELKN